MIVRIMADNQYRLDDGLLPEVQRLDDALDAALAGGDDASFATALSQIVAYVRAHGQLVPDTEVVTSDLIVPADDMTRDEAKALLHPVQAPPAQAPGE
ncbi:MAG TPA: hypothetical protein VF116_13005 [Ktedonobacterales bacterium]